MSNFFFILVVFNTPITSIEFTGNRSISNRELSSALLAKTKEEFVDANVEFDVNRILWAYNKKGFFETGVSPLPRGDSAGIILRFEIREGPRPQIAEIAFDGDTASQLRALLAISTGDFFIHEKIRQSEKQLNDYYRNNGYAFARVTASVVADSGLLVFGIERGSKYYVRGIVIRGLKSCRENVVLREIQVRRGDPYSQERIRRSQRRIYGLGFFGTVDVEMLAEKPDSVVLTFNLRELKSRLLNFGFGVTIPPSFLISFGIEELNLFNHGHRFLIRPSFRIRTGGAWETKFEARYAVPYVTPMRLTLSLLPIFWYENTEEFVKKTTGGEVRISRFYSDHVQANIGNKYKFVDFASRAADRDTNEGFTNSLKLQLMFDYRDDFFNPKKGIFMTPSIEYGGGIFGGTNNFVRPEVEIRFFQPLFKTTLAQRLHAGTTVPTGRLTTAEKYFIGGQYTLRGYEEKSVGPDSAVDGRYGNVIGNYNLEWRVHLPGRFPFSFGAVFFFDAGYLANEFRAANSDLVKFSGGAGLRYYTPVGPVRADVGVPLADRGRTPQFYLGIYHIF